jgi:hypothetical protein
LAGARRPARGLRLNGLGWSRSRRCHCRGCRWGRCVRGCSVPCFHPAMSATCPGSRCPGEGRTILAGGCYGGRLSVGSQRQRQSDRGDYGKSETAHLSDPI